MTQLWAGVSMAEDLATAGGGAAGAAYYLGRSAHGGSARRTAAMLLALLFTGTTLDATTHLLMDEAGAGAALLRAPLALATMAVVALIVGGAGR